MPTTVPAAIVAFVVVSAVLSTFLYLPALAVAESFPPRRANIRAAVWFCALLLPVIGGAAGAGIALHSALYDRYGSPHLTADRPHLCSRWLLSFPDARAVVTIIAIAGAILIAFSVLRAIVALLRSRQTLHRITDDGPHRGQPVQIDDETAFTATVGVLSPVILVTSGVRGALDDDQFRAILAHETAHAIRRDNLRRIIASACRTCLAFAPTAHLFFRYWRQAVERAADVKAAVVTGPEVVSSAMRKLARVTEEGVQKSTLPATMKRWQHTAAEVEARARFLMEEYQNEASAATVGAWVFGGLLVIIGVVAFSLAIAATISQTDDTLHCLGESLLKVFE